MPFEAPALPKMAVVMMVFALDQLSKAWARAVLEPASPISVPPFFDLRLGQSRGVTFGMFPPDDPRGWAVVTLFSAIIIGFVFSWLWRERRLAIAVPVGVIAGGALGNFFDRVRDKAVTDFLDFHVAGWHSPGFNLADVAIAGAIGFLLLDTFARSRFDSPLR